MTSSPTDPYVVGPKTEPNLPVAGNLLLLYK